jgi:hypothetical protein
VSKRNAQLTWLVALSAITMFSSFVSARAQSVVDDSGIVFTKKIFAYSPGWQSCTHWLEARNGNPAEARQMEAWALGYATGYSLNHDRERSDHYEITNEKLFSAIDEKCKSPAVLGIPMAVNRILEAEDKAAQN